MVPQNNWGEVKKVLSITALFMCVTHLGCASSAELDRIEFVDRNTVPSHDLTPKPLMLVIEVDEGGGLRLNKIETGTIADTSLLAEKLEAIFDDREKAGIDQREVLVDSKINRETEGLGELIGTLADVKASPIRVIRNNP